MSVIDAQGYRFNVGMMLRNQNGNLLLARRTSQHNWQFPQGGMLQGETPEESMYRELFEELGLPPKKVRILAQTSQWYSYRLPRQFIRRNQYPRCIGQKQKWFLLDFLGENADIQLDKHESPEFGEWSWFNPFDPLYPLHTLAIFFKRDVYQLVLHEFTSQLIGEQLTQSQNFIVNR